MAFKAQLLLENESFTVWAFTWAISQPTDALGRPSTRAQGGTMQLELDSQSNALLEFWALDDTKRLDGVVSVFEESGVGVRDKIEFFDAQCTLLRKQYHDDAHSARGGTMLLELSANKLQYAEVTLTNDWLDASGR